MSEEIVSEYFLNPWAIPYFLAALASLIIIIILIYKAEKNPPVLLFTGAQISNMIVSLAATLATCVQEGHPNLWNLWAQVNGLFGIVTVVIFFHFSYSYLNANKFLPNRMILFIYVIPIFWGIIRSVLYFRYIHLTDRSVLGLYDVEPSTLSTQLYILTYLIIAFFLILTTINFIKMFRSDDSKVKPISGYFLLASSVPLLALTIWLLIYYISPEFYLKVELTNLSTVVSNLIIGYGISKKDLFDINEVLRTKIIPYALTNFFITWVLVLTKEAINHIFAQAFFAGVTELSMGLMILIFIPVHDLIHKFTRKLLPATPEVDH